MIRKPSAEWTRQADQRGARLRAVGTMLQKQKTIVEAGERKVKAGLFAVHGMVLIGFGLLWIFAGLGGLASGSPATFIGAGGMGWAAIWFGSRTFRKSKAQILPPRAAAGPATTAPSVEPAEQVAGADRAYLDRADLDHTVTFDPDAIIARHLAEKQRLAVQSQPEPVPLAQPGAPARTAFGRKVA